MKITDFSVGQKAYIVGDGRYRSKVEAVTEAEVIKVGRIYVTVKRGNGQPMMFSDMGKHDRYLVEKTEYGAPRLLYLTMQAYEEDKELDELRMWLRQAGDNARAYTLEQLRAVKKIIEGEEKEGAK